MSRSTDDLVVATFKGARATATRRYPMPPAYNSNTVGQTHGGMLWRRPLVPSNPRENRPKNHSCGLGTEMV